jgi:hypothetical protein
VCLYLRRTSVGLFEKTLITYICYRFDFFNIFLAAAPGRIDDRSHPVEVAFSLVKVSEIEPIVGFEVGNFDLAHSILIDPTLTWNTIIG